MLNFFRRCSKGEAEEAASTELAKPKGETKGRAKGVLTPSPGKKPLSQSKDAIRKRRARAKGEKKKSPLAQSPEVASEENRADDFEMETHYLDPRGRKRKRRRFARLHGIMV